MALSDSDLLITNILAPLNGNFQKCSIEIKGTQISRVHPPNYSSSAGSIINGQNQVLLPQIIDAHVHFREPGNSEKETIATGSLAAIAGGITTVLDMPNTHPPIINIKSLNNKILLAQNTSHTNIGFFIYHSPNTHYTPDFLEKTCGIKVYTYDFADPVAELEKLFKILSEFDSPPPVAIHVEDKHLFQLSPDTCQPRDLLTTWNSIRPPIAETQLTMSILELIKRYPLQSHFCHVSASATAKLLHDAQQKAQPITWEVTPHHILFNTDDHSDLLVWGKVNPPLRSKIDQTHLLEALRDGWPSIVASDHAPHTSQEKEEGNPLNAPSGIIGVETLVPVLTTLWSKQFLTLDQIYSLLCITPAKIYGIPPCEIKPGSSANLTLIDPTKPWTLSKEDFHGKTKTSPYLNMPFIGQVQTTIIKGQLVYDKGEFFNETLPPVTVYQSYSRTRSG